MGKHEEDAFLIGKDQRGYPVYDSPSTFSAEEISRRDFISKCLMGSTLLASMGVGGGFVIRYLYPDLNATKKELVKKLVAKTSEISSDKPFVFTAPNGKQIYVGYFEGKYIALSRKCTHLGCMVGWQEDKKVFYCPCHGGTFNTQGEVIAGPPPTPLEVFKIDVENNNVYIHVEEA